MNNEQNSKGLLRELTAIRVQLDTISDDVKYLKSKVESFDRKITILESYEAKIEDLDRKCNKLETQLANHELKINIINNTLSQIVDEKSFKYKVWWNFVILLTASLLASLIVLFASKLI
ncbi:hypothetical protein DRO24_06090 [Candidatus Bathyarchaeota archaeon]|nr:MAG: hypothetical protein DRO24_06090 [Candidatus Bathyarchaeota archaeon]